MGVENDALDEEKRSARVARLHGVLRRVADDARAAILTPPSHEKTVCTTTPLFDDELQQLVQQAYDYYTQPAPEGAPYGGMPSTRSWTTRPADEHVRVEGSLGGERREVFRRGVRAAERRLL